MRFDCFQPTHSQSAVLNTEPAALPSSSGLNPSAINCRITSSKVQVARGLRCANAFAKSLACSSNQPRLAAASCMPRSFSRSPCCQSKLSESSGAKNDSCCISLLREYSRHPVVGWHLVLGKLGQALLGRRLDRVYRFLVAHCRGLGVRGLENLIAELRQRRPVRALFDFREHPVQLLGIEPLYPLRRPFLRPFLARSAALLWGILRFLAHLLGRRRGEASQDHHPAEHVAQRLGAGTGLRHRAQLE